MHEQNYGYAFESEPIEIVNLKLTAMGRLLAPAQDRSGPRTTRVLQVRRRLVTFSSAGPLDTPIYSREPLAAHQVIVGPAVIEQVDTTTIVFPGDVAMTDVHGNLVITLQ